MQALKRFNRGHGWLLVSVDNYTKYLTLVPLQTKGTRDMESGLKSVIDSVEKLGDYHIRRIHTDQGM